MFLVVSAPCWDHRWGIVTAANPKSPRLCRTHGDIENPTSSMDLRQGQCPAGQRFQLQGRLLLIVRTATLHNR